MIAYYSARTPLLAGTLRRALTMGNAKKSCDEAITQVAIDYGLGDVINRLGGLEGKVAEGGGNLSSGECRRLMLARIVLSDAHLILLDEPDDALDSSGAELIQKVLKDTSATCLLITHNMTIVRQMDELWCLKDGKLIGTGAPNIMIKHDGLTVSCVSSETAA